MKKKPAVSEICPACEGRGVAMHKISEATFVCPRCRGRGVVKEDSNGKKRGKCN